MHIDVFLVCFVLISIILYILSKQFNNYMATILSILSFFKLFFYDLVPIRFHHFYFYSGKTLLLNGYLCTSHVQFFSTPLVHQILKTPFLPHFYSLPPIFFAFKILYAIRWYSHPCKQNFT